LNKKELSGFHSEVVVFLNEYVNEYIRFADTKAGFAITVVSLVIAAAFTSDIPWALHLAGDRGCPSWALAWGFLLTGVSCIILGISVVYPRTSNKPPKGLVFWENVTQHASAIDYSSFFCAQPEESLVKLLAEQHYYLSWTAQRKYKVLRWLLPLTAITVFLGLLVAIYLP
jgi:hypothetical protein